MHLYANRFHDKEDTHTHTHTQNQTRDISTFLYRITSPGHNGSPPGGSGWIAGLMVGYKYGWMTVIILGFVSNMFGGTHVRINIWLRDWLNGYATWLDAWVAEPLTESLGWQNLWQCSTGSCMSEYATDNDLGNDQWWCWVTINSFVQFPRWLI